MQRPTTTQALQGDQGVQIGYAADGATITITYNNGATRAVPLQRATVPAALDAKSPARLMRARSDVVPFAARKKLRRELIEWLKGDDSFAGAVIGGSGGTGKTRLAVELCDWAEEAGWLSGILAPIEDLGSLEALADTEIPRLIAVDYAESRASQLNELLPLLASRATQEASVRVLLLVRAGPKRTTDWAESLRNQSDLLDNVLDRCKMHVLEELPLDEGERAELFEVAAGAFAERNGTASPPVPTTLLESSAFNTPLLVVLAAYLAVHGEEAPPSTREELLRAVLLHEERYWRSSSKDLFKDEAQRRWVIALSTLLSAESEAEAVERLRLHPDFPKAPPDELGPIARWAADQYPGTGWWNPLEPDLVGEQLIADEFSGQPGVLAGALAGERPQQLIRPLEVFGRAAGSHPELAAALQPILEAELPRLCAVAIAQARNEADHDLLYGNAVTLAAVLEKAIGSVEVGPDALVVAHSAMPEGLNLVLNSLAFKLSLQLVEHLRTHAKVDPATDPNLASALNNLSFRTTYVGRRTEGLAASEESVEIFRRLVAEDPAVYECDLAKALNNLSLRLGEAERYTEALIAIEESIEIHRRLAAEDFASYAFDLTKVLNNLAVRLGEGKRHREALTAIEESVGIRRRLVAEDAATYEPDLARALTNLSTNLAGVGHGTEGLSASEESVEIFRRLVARDRAAYEPALATALNNLSLRLDEVERRTEGLTAIEECVEIRRRLATEDAATYGPDLARALYNMSISLKALERPEDSERARREAVDLRGA